MRIEPYLFFNGRCDEAIAFYGKALGAKSTFLMRYKDAPPSEEMKIDPKMADKVMHCNISIGDVQIMASDGNCVGDSIHEGYSLSINAKDVPEAQRLFNALQEGGQTVMPFQKTFWAAGFGMVKDKFGVLWMLSSEH